MASPRLVFEESLVGIACVCPWADVGKGELEGSAGGLSDAGVKGLDVLFRGCKEVLNDMAMTILFQRRPGAKSAKKSYGYRRLEMVTFKLMNEDLCKQGSEEGEH